MQDCGCSLSCLLAHSSICRQFCAPYTIASCPLFRLLLRWAIATVLLIGPFCVSFVAARSLTQQESAPSSTSSATATAIAEALAKNDVSAASRAITDASARSNVAALANAMAIALASGEHSCFQAAVPGLNCNSMIVVSTWLHYKASRASSASHQHHEHC
jgi:ethanolamine transporter EutH